MHRLLLSTLSVIGIIEEIEKSLKVEVPHKVLNIAKNEIPYQSLNYDKIKKLGWKNNESIKTTAKRIYEWYKEIVDEK